MLKVHEYLDIAFIYLNYLVLITTCSQLSMQIITNINLKRLMNSKGKKIIY